MTLFSSIALAPRDPILGLTEQFNADPNPNKVNLGVGVYYDENGKLPLLKCVAQAERQMLEAPKARGYLPIDGIAAYDRAVQGLVFGADSPAVQAGRIATVQALGGTGGLKIGADFLKLLDPHAQVLISDPSWENHRALFAQAGFPVGSYPYYDAARRGVNFEAMLAGLQAAAPGTVVVLHACCHNPTGYDLTTAQWQQVVNVVKAGRLVAFLDMAYQGFGDGITEDGEAVRQFLASGLDFFVSTSFSKSFSLYGERVGALSVVCEDKDEATRVLSQLKIVIRTNYSNPPTHGAQVVATVLSTPALRALWEEELAGMRDRIKQMRNALATRLTSKGGSATVLDPHGGQPASAGRGALNTAAAKQDMQFIALQRGMFSYSGLTQPQMLRLRTEFGIYGTDSGRICVAALNAGNIDPVAQAIVKVI